MDKYKYVIIGSGAAGINAAKTISDNTDEDILVITEETYPYYYRPKIIDYIAGTSSFDDFKYFDEDWYKQRKIKVIYNTSAVKINAEKKHVILNKGNPVQYEKLLIATGGKPFIPQPYAEAGGITIRKLNDADEIIKKAGKAKTFCIIGGGLLGLEAAGALAKIGKEVHIIETAPYPLPRQLDEEGGIVLKKKLASLGIHLHTGTGIEKIDSKNARLTNGEEFTFENAIICTGIKPAIDFTVDTGIKIDRAIMINDYMETSIPDVYAAGDACIHNGELYGSWMPALEQGEAAGLNMIGEKTAYKGSARSFRLKVVGVDLVSIGNISLASANKVMDEAQDVYKKAFIEDGRLVGFILYGDTRDEMELLKNISKDFSLSSDFFIKKERQMTGGAMHVCDICGYVYDPAKGDTSRGIAPGTPFEKLPADWDCPVCGAEKKKFSKI